MCFPKTPKIETPAQPAPPAAEGATSLVLGGGINDEEESLRNRGLLGRLALRVGRGSNASRSVGSGRSPSSAGGSTAGGIGGVGPSGAGSGGTGSSGGGLRSPSKTFSARQFD